MELSPTLRAFGLITAVSLALPAGVLASPFVPYPNTVLTPAVVPAVPIAFTAPPPPAMPETIATIGAVEVVPTPEPTPVPTVVPTARPTAIQVAVQPSGRKYDWLAAAGIPQTDWANVDLIVQHESGWNPNAVNASSGACGLVQFLPCSVAKAGADWNNPVNALRRGDAYAKARYGSWAGAVAHWQSARWW